MRNPSARIQPDMFGGALPIEVGARHKKHHPPQERGGYPGVCTGSEKSSSDPRLNELRDIGLAYHWLRVAETIGVDAFLDMWRVLDENNLGRVGLREPVRIRVPLFDRWTKHQRNCLIESLSSENLSPEAILAELSKAGFALTKRQLQEIRKAQRAKKKSSR